ncbi:MAG: hypothetical protein NTU61_00685, partial [Candidatus Altiarchaeota archaeon]|nr:hypothetical protein [Candidatus Altiarchaeota archaeon]
LHYFTAEFPDEKLSEVAVQFMRGMQMLLLNEIFKKCHTVTFKQITSDIIPLDFHVIVLRKERLELRKDLIEKNVGNLTLVYDPRELYSTGTVSYFFGTEDLKFKDVLLYHGFLEVTADFLMNMLRKMTRLYHEADKAVSSVESSTGLEAVKEAMDLSDAVIKECGESFGKLKQAKLNIVLKLEEYNGTKLDKDEKALAEALGIEKSLKRINEDADYLIIQWQDVLLKYIENVDSTLDARVMLHIAQKRRGLFG